MRFINTKYSYMKILIIEDEPKVVAFLQQGLEEKNYSVDVAVDGMEGIRLASENNYDFILLDIILPQMDGMEVCRKIRTFNTGVHIIMLTALATLQNKLDGFDAGVDDYLVKPFEFKELLARMNTLKKRAEGPVTEKNILKAADIELDLDKKLVRRGNREFILSSKEFALLELLMRNKGKVLSRQQIAEKIWDINFDTGTNVVDVYINLLRKKIEKDFPNKHIQTRIGMGYYFEEE